MQYLNSPLQKKCYLSAMKETFGSPFNIFNERITGFTFGPFFAVAHHQPWEWNRKITSECNRAYGFVKMADGELKVCFLRSRGLFSPFWIAFYTLFCKVIFAFRFQESGILEWVISVVISLVVCGITALQTMLTENGETGLRELYKFLQNPEEYYG